MLLFCLPQFRESCSQNAEIIPDENMLSNNRLESNRKCTFIFTCFAMCAFVKDSIWLYKWKIVLDKVPPKAYHQTKSKWKCHVSFLWNILSTLLNQACWYYGIHICLTIHWTKQTMHTIKWFICYRHCTHHRVISPHKHLPTNCLVDFYRSIF